MISIIIPMKNEALSLKNLFDELLFQLMKLPFSFEIIAVNDGSSDNTLELLLDYKQNIPQLKILNLSRNFGKEAALYAGFEHCIGDCAISIDADLQDPPALIPDMINYWLDGYEVVTAVHDSRQVDPFIKKITASFFYKIINKISDTKLTPNAGDYRLLDRKAIDAFLQLSELVRFNKGLFAWIGFKEKLVYHEREIRVQGSTQWNYIKLFKFSLDGITSFSKFPLEVWFYLGFIISGLGFVYAIYYFIKTIIFGIAVNGYPSLLIFILFFSGVQMIGIGILGKYIGRIFVESKRRPIYLKSKFYE